MLFASKLLRKTLPFHMYRFVNPVSSGTNYCGIHFTGPKTSSGSFKVCIVCQTCSDQPNQHLTLSTSWFNLKVWLLLNVFVKLYCLFSVVSMCRKFLLLLLNLISTSNYKTMTYICIHIDNLMINVKVMCKTLYFTSIVS